MDSFAEEANPCEGRPEIAIATADLPYALAIVAHRAGVLAWSRNWGALARTCPRRRRRR